MTYPTVCCQCNKLKVGEKWESYKLIFVQKISHGLCMPCSKIYLEKIEEQRIQREQKKN